MRNSLEISIALIVILLLILLAICSPVKHTNHRNSGRENGQYSEYIVERDVGSIHYARGKLFILEVLLKGKNSKEWSRKDLNEQRIKSSIAFTWILEKAEDKYGINDLDFDIEIADLSRYKRFHKFIIPIRSNSSSRFLSKNVDWKWIKMISNYYGYENPEDFYSYLKGEKYDGVAVLMFFLLNHFKRSYAPRWLYNPNKNYPEYAVIYFFKHGNDPYTISHEFLHLAGADDLYNKENLSVNFCKYDIFNNYLAYMVVPTLCKLTAFAIGWLDRCPPEHDHLIIKDLSSKIDKKRRQKYE